MFRSLRVQILALALIPVILTGLFGILALDYSLKEVNREVSANVEETIYSIEKKRLENIITSAIGAIEKPLSMPGKQGMEDGLEILSTISYDDGVGYIFVYDEQGVRLVQGDTDAGIGQNFFNLEDQQGNKLIQGLLKSSKSGEGFYTYYFPKPGETQASAKTSYAHWIPKWQVMVGTGFYIDSTEAIMANISDQFVSAEKKAVSASSLMYVLILVGLIAVASYLIKFIYRPLHRLVVSMKELAKGEGDLTQQLPSAYISIVDNISSSFNQFMAALNKDIKELQVSAQELSVLANEATAKSNEIDSSLHKQEEETLLVASAIDEMASTATQIADSAMVSQASAEQADQQVAETSVTVDKSVESMSNLDTMLNSAESSVNELGDNVKAINEFLAVIQGISEQTNLLALNAAIEAARAGEQGRGFAVVADEVRTLAQKSAQSTEEISQILDKLQKSSGKTLDEMGQAREQREAVVSGMTSIQETVILTRERIRELTDQNVMVATSATEQSSVSEDIQERVNGVKELSENIRQESQSARELFASLNDLSDQLTAISNKFKV